MCVCVSVWLLCCSSPLVCSSGRSAPLICSSGLFRVLVSPLLFAFCLLFSPFPSLFRVLVSPLLFQFRVLSRLCAALTFAVCISRAVLSFRFVWSRLCCLHFICCSRLSRRCFVCWSRLCYFNFVRCLAFVVCISRAVLAFPLFLSCGLAFGDFSVPFASLIFPVFLPFSLFWILCVPFASMFVSLLLFGSWFEAPLQKMPSTQFFPFWWWSYRSLK